MNHYTTGAQVAATAQPLKERQEILVVRIEPWPGLCGGGGLGARHMAVSLVLAIKGGLAGQ